MDILKDWWFTARIKKAQSGTKLPFNKRKPAKSRKDDCLLRQENAKEMIMNHKARGARVVKDGEDYFCKSINFTGLLKYIDIIVYQQSTCQGQPA